MLNMYSECGMNNNWRFILFYPFDFLLAMIFRLLAPCLHGTREAVAAPWVIGGHRGRLYEDNSAALHRYITGRTSQPVIWIANAALVRELRGRGCRALRRNSLAARWAIIRAPVLIYSHGEDDLDQFLKFFRSCLGLRVYLNHGLNYLKMEHDPPDMSHWSSLRRFWHGLDITDFDLLPTISPEEKRAYDLAFPDHRECILPSGGGAHVDNILRRRETPPANQLVWFPTFRDTAAEEQGLNNMLREVLTSAWLAAWLERENLKLAVVRHVNLRLELPPLSERVSFHEPGDLLDLLERSQLLISDYSSVQLDWMLFDRPMLHFPFDEDLYVRSRAFFHTPEEIQYGPLVHTHEELRQVLESGAWKDPEPYAEKRRHWQNLFFPGLRPGCAERCLECIRTVLAQREA